MKSVSSLSEVSFGLMAATTLPALMTNRWSASSSICGKLWPTTTTVSPWSAVSRMIRKKAAVSRGPRAAVGSSRSTTRAPK